MMQVLFDGIRMLWSLYKIVRQSISEYKAPVEITTPVEEESEGDEDEDNNVCNLCYGAHTNPAAAVCGHVFCWNCIMLCLKIKPECPTCRKSCLPQKVVILNNY